LREYGGDPVLAVAAYNAGRGNVNKWINDQRWSGGEGDINSIPFGETREYVKKCFIFIGNTMKCTEDAGRNDGI